MIVAHNAQSGRGFYRDKDRAVLGGVCAGLAEYLGFNLKVTRLLAVIAFLMAMPIAVIAYMAAVFLIPSVSDKGYDSKRKKRRFGPRKSRKKDVSNEVPKSSLAEDINIRCRSMDERLAHLEKLVTSRRFQLEQELNRL